MRINVHAGHNADGRTACGAIGFIRESTETVDSHRSQEGEGRGGLDAAAAGTYGV